MVLAGLNHAKQSLQCEGGQEIADTHLWFGNLLGLQAAHGYIPTKEKIQHCFATKDAWEKALELQDLDEKATYSTHTALGQWHLSVTQMPMLERKRAHLLYQRPPTSTYENAEYNFREALASKPGYLGAAYWLAEVCLCQGRKDEAKGLLLNVVSGQGIWIQNADGDPGYVNKARSKLQQMGVRVHTPPTIGISHADEAAVHSVLGRVALLHETWKLNWKISNEAERDAQSEKLSSEQMQLLHNAPGGSFNLQVQLQLCRVLHEQATLSDSPRCASVISKGLEHAQAALNLPGGEGTANTHFWNAALLGLRLEKGYATAQERIQIGVVYKKEMDRALELGDDSCHTWYALGRWHMSVCSMSWTERKIASKLMSDSSEMSSSWPVVERCFIESLSAKPGYISAAFYLAEAYDRQGKTEDHLRVLAEIASATEPWLPSFAGDNDLIDDCVDQLARMTAGP